MRPPLNAGFRRTLTGPPAGVVSTMAFNVFVSYSTRDLGRGTQVKRLLEGTGSTVFLAEYTLPAGARLDASIEAAIKSCDLFVLLWSTHARASEWVPQEIGIAKATGKPVIPVMLHPGLELPGFLKGLKYLPLYNNAEQSLAWLRRNVFERAQQKQQRDGLVWLGLGAVVLMLLAGRE